jgi:hypothetical protein
MKLNLLPTTVSKGKQAKTAVIFSVLIALAGVGIGGFLSVSSQKALDQAKADQAESVGPAQTAYQKSADADTIIQSEKSVDLIRNAMLADAMIKHNDVYPDLYEEIKPYIPSFFRINSLSAVSAGENANITMVGTINTFQQYADLMLAFSRYKNLISISRSGFIDRRAIVPNINSVDSEGRVRRQDEAPIPDDKLLRLAYFQSQPQPGGFTGEGNFGSGTDNTKGAMPEASLITVVLTIKKDLRVPEPRQTLSSGGASAAGTAPTGPPANIPTPPAGGGDTSAPTSKGGKKSKGDDSSD